MSTDAGIAATSGDGVRQRENRTKSKDKMPSKASSRESSEESDSKRGSKSDKDKNSSRRKPKKIRQLVEDEGSGADEDVPTVVDQEGNLTLHDGTMVVQPEPVDDAAPRAKQAASQSAKRVLEDLEVVSCSACNKQMNPNISGAVRRHPVLKVLICKKCYNWYASDEIDQDSEGMDEQCRWCGEGGNLLCCDYCHNAFCKGCIKRNLGRQALSDLLGADEDEKWHCFVCNLKPLDALIQDANETLRRIEERRKLKKEQRERGDSPKPSGSIDKGKGGPFKSSAKRGFDLDTVRELIPESLLTKFTTATYETSSADDEMVPLDFLSFTLEKLYQSTKAQFEVITEMRNSLSKSGEQEKPAEKGNRKLCTQLRHVINTQKQVYTDIDVMFVNARNGPRKRKLKKPESDTESMDSEVCPKSMNGAASTKEKHDLKIRLSNGKIKRANSSSDVKNSKKEVKKEVKSEVKSEVKAEVKEESDMKEESDSELIDVGAILAGCGTTNDSEDMEESSTGINHLLAEVDALNRSLSKDDASQVNGDSDNDSDDASDSVDRSTKPKRTECKSSRPSRTNIEAQRELHKELLESSSDEDDEDGDDSEENYLSSSSEHSGEASSGEEYRPAELDKEKRDEKLERRRQRLQERRNRRKMKAKETKAKNIANSDEEEEEAKAPDNKKKGKKGKNSKNKQEDSDEEKDSGKKTKKGKDAQEKSSKKKGKKSQESDDDSDGESNKKNKKEVKKEDKKSNKKNNKTATSESEDEVEEVKKSEAGKKKNKKNAGKKSTATESESEDVETEKKADAGKKKKTDKKGTSKKSTATDSESEDVETEKKADAGKKKKNDKKGAGKKSTATDSESEDVDTEKKADAGKKKKNDKKGAGKKSTATDSESEDVETEKKADAGKKKKNDKKGAGKKSTATDSESEDVETEKKADAGKKKKTDKKGAGKKSTATDSESEDVETEKKADAGKKKKNDKKGVGKKSAATDSESEENVKGGKKNDKSDAGEQGNKAEQGKGSRKGKKGGSQADEGEGNSEEDQGKSAATKGTKSNKSSKKREKAAKSKEDEDSDDSLELDKEISDLEKLPTIKKGKEVKLKDADSGKQGKTKDKSTSGSKRLTASERRQKQEQLLDELDSDASVVEEEEEEEKEEEKVEDSDDQQEVMAKVAKAFVDAAASDADDEELAEDVEEDSDIEGMMKKDKKESKSKKRSKPSEDDDLMEVISSEDEEDANPKKKNKKKTKKIDLLDEKISDSESDFEMVPKKKKKASKDEDEDEENNDDDNGSDSEPVVKKKRKRKKSSDSSEDYISDSDEDKPQVKKRKRVKKNSDSSAAEEEEEEEDEDGDSPKKGRKFIRKIMKDKKLGDETKQAIKEEEDRRERMAARQKQYNQVTEEDSSPLKVPVTTKLVLEKDEDGETVIEVDPRIIKLLKPHQVEGVKFMWDNVAETVDRLKTTQGSGCILAHCMGLGKTLSVITLVHTLMTNVEKTNVKRVLCVTPLNTVLNWQNEFDKWVDEDDDLEVYELSQVKNNWSRADNLDLWHEGGGVMIVSYEMFRNLTQHRFTKNKKQKKIFTKTLADPGPDLVVCDEGHILKNDASAVSKAMNLVRTKRRIVLTGTPLQNNLVEYHCMVNFVKPNLLGSRKEFSNMFVNPLVNGQCADSTPYDVRLMKKRAHILHEKLDGCVQRRDYCALVKFLPPKQEYVLAVKLSETQIKLYRRYLDMNVAGENAQALGRGTRLFSDYQALMRIWTHPWVLKLEEVRRENNRKYNSDEETDEDDLGSFIDDSTSESEASFSSSDSVEDISDEEGGGTKKKKKKKEKKSKGKTADPQAGPSRRSRRGNSGDSGDVEIVKEWKTRSRKRNEGSDSDDAPEASSEVVPEAAKVTSEWWSEFVTEEDHFKLELSGKLLLLAEILRMSEAIGDKVLLFSQSLLSLDLIEEFLDHWDKQLKSSDDTDETPQIAGNQGWCHGLDYFRMDGSTQAHIRQRWAEIFNAPDNIRARLFLISTKAGGLGINMVAANRVIIFDASWNPSHDVQSIFRVYRFGQTKPSYIYRFLAQGTMEEKIYSRQVTKQSLSQRVVDEHQIERHFTHADLKALYDFQPADEPTETPKLPKDLLLAELLASHRKWIVNYHEHDSLLENKVEEDLTEEERKTAWEEFENEKKGILTHAAQGNMQQMQMNRYPAMNNYVNTQNFMAQQMSGGQYLDLARAIYQQNPTLNVTEVYQRVHQYIQMQMASRQQQQLMLQQQLQQARQSEFMAKAMAEQQQRSSSQEPRHPLYNLMSHIKSPAEPN